jgi:predicted O-linked N-acetylglucosamine transferase (SPINDLY family)
MRQRLRDACEHFVDIARESDDAAATRIRADGIDVLVDLKGYTLGDRLTILARRPCPIQVTWLGYPGTTGTEHVDYVIADAFIVPPAAEAHYAERVLRMPHCYQPNDRARAVAVPLTRAQYGLPADAFVFCCFNQSYKLSADVYDTWMQLLDAVPDSVLWLLESQVLAAENLRAYAHSRGITPERIVFAPRLPNAQHLARYRVADLVLDTFPYGSHTTMSDALWCGCPGIALCGESFASRVSGSLLQAAGMTDLVASSLGEYAAKALRLAADTALHASVRARLEHARNESSLFDPVRFARDLETIYGQVVDAPR